MMKTTINNRAAIKGIMLAITGIVLIGMVFMAASGSVSAARTEPPKQNTQNAKEAPPAPAADQQSEYYDLLILGIDKRPYQKSGRSDVIIIVHCEPGKITLFSIPRDTLVEVRNGKDKINHAFAYGELNLSRSVIEHFLQFKVDNYIVVDFDTFLTTIDVIKKLTDDGRLIGADNFLISGENLLKWLRYRGYSKGDRRRCQRHQLFIKRVFEYTQNIYKNQPAIFGQCMKAGLKIVETDLTYDHAAQLLETYKNLDLEKDMERFVVPGAAAARYRANLNVSTAKYEAMNMPNFSAVVAAEGLEGEEAAKRKAALQGGWRSKQVLVNYYVPKYDWSLVTYIRWFRKNGITMNYKEEDTLRK